MGLIFQPTFPSVMTFGSSQGSYILQETLIQRGRQTSAPNINLDEDDDNDASNAGLVIFGEFNISSYNHTIPYYTQRFSFMRYLRHEAQSYPFKIDQWEHKQVEPGNRKKNKE